MEGVSALKNKGEGKSCIIIGSGNSVKYFPVENLGLDIDRIGINFTKFRYMKYIICDKGVPQKLGRKRNGKRYIGFDSDPVGYCFDDSIVLGDHTGFRALQIADQIMSYENIYLIGYDYYDEDGVVHYFGDDFHKYWINWSDFYPNRKKYFKRQVEEFDIIKWKNNIYNLNPKSLLKRFPIADLG